MQFPLTFKDISIWLAVTAIILLVASELISPYVKTNVLINKKRLRTAALTVGIIFLITAAIGIYTGMLG